MAAPIGIILAVVGGAAGYQIQFGFYRRRQLSGVLLTFGFFLPLLMSGEKALLTTPRLIRVDTAVDIKASPEVVWRNVIAFPELAAPGEWFFHAGISYPLRARIEGVGPGAIRYCSFSTGDFVEPIVVWDEPRLLRFTVTKNPPPMAEWTLFRDLHPPHLTNFFVAEAGEFKLVRKPHSRTRLVGSTWYRHHIWPEWYWQLWSDAIVQRIHLRVLEHIKGLAED
jgi:hypothetical protein